jgi:DNA-directed RNA polymerase specialized sigma24 family protein
MNLMEATKRLRENHGDKTALRDFYNHFDNFIIYIVRDAASLYPEFDAEDAEQELRQTLLEVIDRYQPSYDETQWENYIFQALRNHLHDIVRHFYVERKHVPVSIDRPVAEDESGAAVRLEDQLVSLEKDIYSILESAEAEAFIDSLQDQLAKDSSEKGQLAWKVFTMILEATPESLTQNEVIRQLQEQYPDEKWYKEKIFNVLSYLRSKLTSLGFSEDWALA